MNRFRECRSLLALVLALATVSCVSPYRPPTKDQPHAVVKLRRSYEKQPGPNLAESFQINGYSALSKHSEPSETPRADAILVHPELAEWNVSANFFHRETRLVQESYTEQEPYTTTESYNCGGYGGTSSYRTCTRTVTKYRSVTKQRTVHKQVQVSDGSCQRELRLLPKVGGVYLLQFTYQDNGVCRLSCFEQAEVDGKLQSSPCPLPPPKE